MTETRTWLITGTSRGIGLELTRQLLADPSNLIIATCRTPDRATALHALKDPAKGTLHIVALDVADEASIHASRKPVEEALGGRGLDYLYNNAAINEGDDTAFTLDAATAVRTFQANVVGPALIAQTFLPLLEKGSRKVIVNMSSGLASIGIGGEMSKCATYSISKTALNMLVRVRSKRSSVRTSSSSCSIPERLADMGGEGAVLEPEFSVSSILKVVTSLTAKESGKFFRYDGSEIPW